MRERIESFRGCAWLEAIGAGAFLVFASETAEEALGVVVQERGASHYLWRVWGNDEAVMAIAATKTTAVAAVLANAGSA